MTIPKATSEPAVLRKPAAAVAPGVAIAWTAGLVLIGVAVLFRGWRLGSIPGINGDEAWAGVLVLQAIHGETFPWRTPTGNPLNPLFFGPQWLLHSLFPPSFTLLRITPLVSGVVALAANYLLARKSLGLRSAMISTVLLAVLPINIAYSRFAWDSCQTVLAAVFVVHLSLLAVQTPQRRGRYSVAACVAFATAVLVHPTNLFLAPILATALVWESITTSSASLAARLRGRPGRQVVTGLLIVLFAAAAVPSVQAVSRLERAFHLQELLEFCSLYGRLFSGVTVYQFISGAMLPADEARSSILFLDGLYWSVFALLGYGVYRTMMRSSAGSTTCLLAGYALSVAGFYVVAGSGALAPHFERYGICLIAPACTLAAIGLTWWIERGGWRAGTMVTASIAVATLMLVGFYVHYLDVFQTTGGKSHQAFRTGPSEPKLAALELIAENTPPGQVSTIVTSEWWSYWPLCYAAFDRVHIEVQLLDRTSSTAAGQGSAAGGPVWTVEFSSAALLNDPQTHRATVGDPAGVPILSIMGPFRAQQ